MGRIPGYSPANVLSAQTQRILLYVKITIAEHVFNHTSSMAARPCLCSPFFLEACPVWAPLFGESPRVWHGAPMAFPS